MLFFYYYLKYIYFLYRQLTPEQKKLMLEFAEIDKATEGTVNGSSQTKSGK